MFGFKSKSKTFARGGIHPEANKLSSDKQIEVLAVPEKVFIPLSQHIGAPAKPVVAKGDEVKVGTLIAEAGGFISANIHSSVSGKVEKIDKVVAGDGYEQDMVVIKVDGDEFEENIIISDELIKEITLSKEEIINKVKDAGIVGMGGAGFPSHVKYMVPEGMKAETLIINGVECEPYLTADHRLMLEKSEEILIGIKILMKALEVKEAIIGIENNKPDVIEKLSGLVKSDEYAGISIEGLKTQYPQGGEKQLINALTGKEVPSGGLPIAIGCVVQNVGTCFAVYEAVQKNKPLIDRVVTLTGKSVEKPANYLCRVGVTADKLIEVSGGIPEDTLKIVNGGPMMGKALANLAAPITKTSSGILIVSHKDGVKEFDNSCIRCASCVDVCPAGLSPYLIALNSKNNNFEAQLDENVFDCIECGSCTHVCPAKIPLLDYCRLGKREVKNLLNDKKKG